MLWTMVTTCVKNGGSASQYSGSTTDSNDLQDLSKFCLAHSPLQEATSTRPRAGFTSRRRGCIQLQLGM